MTVVVDSSIFIEYFRTKNGAIPLLIRDMEFKQISIAIPTMVIFELWRGKSMKIDSISRKTEQFLNQFQIIPDTFSISKLAGELERERYTFGNDAIIAATCLEHNAQLATLNPKDFARVPRLKLWKAE
jgi:predicted nucleic acid-binding protein